jgi:RNase P subunit RPR2
MVIKSFSKAMRRYLKLFNNYSRTMEEVEKQPFCQKCKKDVKTYPVGVSTSLKADEGNVIRNMCSECNSLV